MNAAVLGPDVDGSSETLKLFIKDVAREMTQKAGQKCTATRRVFAPRARLDAAREALIERLSQVRVGDPPPKARHGAGGERRPGARRRGGMSTISRGAEVAYGEAPGGNGFVAPRLSSPRSRARGGGASREVFGPSPR